MIIKEFSFKKKVAALSVDLILSEAIELYNLLYDADADARPPETPEEDAIDYLVYSLKAFIDRNGGE